MHRRRYESRHSPKPKLHRKRKIKYGEARFLIWRVKFFFPLRFWPDRRNLRAILNQVPKFSLQCDTWLWDHDTDFARWQHRWNEIKKLHEKLTETVNNTIGRLLLNTHLHTTVTSNYQDISDISYRNCEHVQNNLARYMPLSNNVPGIKIYRIDGIVVICSITRFRNRVPGCNTRTRFQIPSDLSK